MKQFTQLNLIRTDPRYDDYEISEVKEGEYLYKDEVSDFLRDTMIKLNNLNKHLNKYYSSYEDKVLFQIIEDIGDDIYLKGKDL